MVADVLSQESIDRGMETSHGEMFVSINIWHYGKRRQIAKNVATTIQLLFDFIVRIVLATDFPRLHKTSAWRLARNPIESTIHYRNDRNRCENTNSPDAPEHPAIDIKYFVLFLNHSGLGRMHFRIHPGWPFKELCSAAREGNRFHYPSLLSFIWIKRPLHKCQQFRNSQSPQVELHVISNASRKTDVIWCRRMVVMAAPGYNNRYQRWSDLLPEMVSQRRGFIRTDVVSVP